MASQPAMLAQLKEVLCGTAQKEAEGRRGMV